MTVQELLNILINMPGNKKVFISANSGELGWVNDSNPNNKNEGLIVIGMKI